ncbi:DUF2358 domain-containing protein [Phormidium sp. CCY1219]|uniref:DUF2358 domain-containing protein n=1 Tax=Phormidium sp. CCY1219 TaxID=2886104 RepID=UPI002D1F8908|nr:DUF2358 domain-containing protein [Phormidium sp. CCY1219]MEB3831468.1 DUF2358 domain-containing protein [Phormidium sp. CCY1219]
MDIIQILKQDYQRFPENQTYSIYTEEVYFKDPMNEFRGRDRYEQTIEFISKWFKDVQMDLHDIRRRDNTIETRWTLHWTAPVPWEPRISIPGTSELKLNRESQIISHIDYWDISRLDVLKQLFFPRSPTAGAK